MSNKQYSSLEVVTAPAAEPVSLDDVKAFMRIDNADEDSLITELISAARQLCEQHLRKTLIHTTYKLTLDHFPRCSEDKWWDGVVEGHIGHMFSHNAHLVLPAAPLESVTSITSYNDANTATVLDNSSYIVDTAGARIALNDGQTWPTDVRDTAACEVVYVAGYGADASSVPSAIKHAIKITVAAMYEDRECFGIPAAAHAALKPYREMTERYNV
jgi:hypothetical protein